VQKGLMVIDLQSCYLKGYSDQSVIDSVIKETNVTIKNAQASGDAIIYIQHEFKGMAALFMRAFNNSCGLSGGEGFETDTRVLQVSASFAVKHAGDAFSVKAVEDWLQDNQLSAVQLVGQDGNHCVQATARGALARGLDVSVIDNAVSAQNGSKWLKNKIKLAEEGVVFRH